MPISQANTNDENSPFLGKLGSITGAPNLQASITLAFRVRWASTAVGDNQTCLAYVATSGSDLSGIYIARLTTQTANTISAYRSNSVGSLNTTTSATGAAPNTTAWIHIAAVYTTGAPGTIQLYVNGVASGTAVNSNATQCTSTTATNIAFVWGLTSAVLADAVIIARALTAAEVLALSRRRVLTVGRGDVVLWAPTNDVSSVTNAGIDYGGKQNNLTAVTGTGAAPAVSAENVPIAWGPRHTVYVRRAAIAINTPTGELDATGTAAMVKTAASGAPTGTVLTSGAAAIAAFAALGNQTGTVLTSGVAAMVAAAAVSPTGVVLTSGTSAMTSAELSGSPVGVVRTSGAAATSASAPIAPSAAVALTTGTATVTSSASVVPTGVVLTSGAAVMASTAAAVPSGVVLTSGAAATSASAPVSPAGVVVTTGVAAMTASSSGAVVPTGVVLTSGTSAMTQSASVAPSGVVVTTGVAAMTSNAAGAVTATGVLLATGDAATSTSAGVSASSSTLETGSAALTSSALSGAPTGVVLTSGAAALASSASVVPRGDVVTTGAALFSSSAAFIASASTVCSGVVSMTGGTPTPPSGGGQGPGYYRHNYDRRGTTTQWRRAARFSR